MIRLRRGNRIENVRIKGLVLTRKEIDAEMNEEMLESNKKNERQ